MTTGELRDRANAAMAMAIAVLARSSHSLARSLTMVPEQWADPAPEPRAPRPAVDETARTGVFWRVTPPGRYRSLTAMSAGFEIERLLTG